MDRPPAGIVELEDGYAVGSYSGAVVHVPMLESGTREAGATVLHSPANAPVTALARGRLLYSGFRSGELAVGGEICARLNTAFPTSLHPAGPGPCELLVVGTSGGAVAVYDPAKSVFVHTVPIYSDASGRFETRPSCATVEGSGDHDVEPLLVPLADVAAESSGAAGQRFQDNNDGDTDICTNQLGDSLKQ